MADAHVERYSDRLEREKKEAVERVMERARKAVDEGRDSDLPLGWEGVEIVS